MSRHEIAEQLRRESDMMATLDLFQKITDKCFAKCVTRPGDKLTNEIRVNDICNTIVDAQNILKQRISETEEEIAALENQKRKLQTQNLIKVTK